MFLMRWVKSLFTTAGRINPLALVLYAGIAWYGFDEIRDYFREKRLVTDSGIVQEAAQDKVEKLNEARNEQKQANQAIDNGDFIDWYNRMRDEN